MLLGFVLGPLMEENLRRAMLIARGDPSTFVTRPISGTLIGLAMLLLVVAVLPMIRAEARRGLRRGVRLSGIRVTPIGGNQTEVGALRPRG